MSFRIAGITTQPNYDYNDGALYQHLLGDGILRGCAITTTQNTINIAPGELIVAGRKVPNDGVHTHTLVSLIDGYIQLKLQIDTGNPQTSGQYIVPNMIATHSTTALFPAITQEDINGNGTIYEVELGVFQVSGGNIVGTIRTIDKATQTANSISYDEQHIGTWMGKPRYRKVINCGALLNNAQKTTPHGISNIDLIVSVGGFATRLTDGLAYNLPHVDLGEPATLKYCISLQVSKTNIYTRTGVDRTGFNHHVIIEYTKTTD